MEAIIPSVDPQHTVTSRSGSYSKPYHFRYLAAMASRNGFAPQVMAYWLKSAAMASCAACLISAGALKSGKPWAKLTALHSMARRVISRITDSVKRLVRWLTNLGRRLAIATGRTEVFCAEGVIKRDYHCSPRGVAIIRFVQTLPGQAQPAVMPAAITILFGAALTVATAWALGAILFQKLSLSFSRLEQYCLAFIVGSACLSAIDF